MASEIAVDLFPFFRVLKDGSVERFMGTQSLPPSPHGDPVASKDVILDPQTGVFVRLYIPPLAQGEKVPVVVYIHGGGFCIESAASPTYHNYLDLLAKEANIICVSVEYRLVPEHRLPAAYDDCFSALQWLDEEGSFDPWIDAHADLSRCFVAGDSAGGNIVHQLGIRGCGRNWRRLHIEGGILVHPFFSGEDTIIELGVEEEAMVKLGDGIWKFSLPEGADKDHPFCNPIAPSSPSRSLSRLVYSRLLVMVAGKDLLKYRAILYYEALKKAGKEADLVTAEEEMHVFHLRDFHCPNALAMTKCIADFIK